MQCFKNLKMCQEKYQTEFYQTKTGYLTGVSNNVTKALKSENAFYPVLPGQTAFLGFSFIYTSPEINNKHQKNHP